MRKNNFLFSLLFSFILVCLVWSLSFNLTINDNNKGKEYKYAQNVASESIMTVGLYSASDCGEDSKEVVLTSDGVECSNSWDYDEPRYLLIDLKKLDANKKYRVKIDMDQALYADIVELPDVSNNEYLEKIEFSKNESISYNNNQEYELEEYSGDFIYYITKGVTLYSFTLQLRYDNTLWNKQGNATIGGYSESDLLKVTIEEVVDDSNDLVETNVIDSVRMISITSGKEPASEFYRDILNKNNNTVSGGGKITLSPRETVQIRIINGLFGNATQPTFYNKVKLYFDIPTCITDGECLGDQMIFNGFTAGNFSADDTPKYEIENTGDQIIVTYYDYLIGKSLVANLEFDFPEKYLNIEGSYEFFSNAKLVFVEDNIETPIFECDSVITCSNSSQAIIKKITDVYSNRIMSVDNDNVGVVQLFGGYGIKNEGNDSGEILVKYDFDTKNSDRMFVTTLSMHPDKVSEYYHVKYSLIDEFGNLVVFDKNTGEAVVNSSLTPIYDEFGNLLDQYTKYWTVDIENTVKADKPENEKISIYDSILFNRSMLVEGHREYYFKSIEYVIGKIEAGTTLYNVNSPDGYGTVGNFWGYIKKGDIVKDVYTEISVYNVVRDENDPTIVSLKEIDDTRVEKITRIKDENSCSFGINKMTLQNAETLEKIDTLAILAGESFIISGEAYIVPYPYSGNNVLNNGINNIRIGIVLPEGASIRAESVVLKNYKGEETFEVDKISYIDIADSINGSVNKFWIIDLKADDGSNDSTIGYANEFLKALKNGDTIKFQFQVDTSLDTSASTIHLKEKLFLAANGIVNAASGSYTYFSVVDKYDLNNNGSTSDKVACLSNQYSDVKVEIQAFNATLEITNRVIGSDGTETYSAFVNNNYDENGNIISDNIQYNLSVECTSGGSANDFVYFIPIVKENSIIDNKLVLANGFSLSLSEVPVVNNIIDDSGLKILYTTENDYNKLIYDNLKKTEIDKEEVSSIVWESDFSKVNLEEVTMLKVVSNNDKLVNGSESLVTVKLGYLGTENERKEKFAERAIFSSYGHYVYNIGNRSMGGHFGTEYVSMQLGYTGKMIETTILINSDDSVDNLDGTYSSNIVINEDVFPKMNITRSMYASNLRLHNVSLVNSINVDGDAVYANSSFDIRMGIFNIGISIPLRYYTIYRLNSGFDMARIGNARSDNAYNLNIKISYLNKITDNFTNRYFIVDIIDYDGGYLQPIKVIIERNLTEVTDAKSSIEAGKVYQIFQNQTDTATITSNGSLTAQFIFNDFVFENYDNESLNFDKKLPINTTITMIDFSNTGSKYYYYKHLDDSKLSINLLEFKKMGTNISYLSDGNGITNRQLLFIIDYPNDYLLETNETQVLTYLIESTNVNVTNIENQLVYTLISDQKYSISSSSNVDINKNNCLELDIMIENYLNINVDKIDNQLTLVLSATDDSYIPADAYIDYSGLIISANSNGQFIIPLYSIDTESEKNFKLMFNSFTLGSTDDICKLIPKLYLSSTFDGTRPMMGDLLAAGEIISITKSKQEEVVLKVDEMSDRAFDRDDLQKNVVLKYTTLNCNNKITVELQELDGYAYILNKTGITSINNVSTRVDGVFDITIANGILNIKLGNDLPINKYQLVFNVYDENEEIIFKTVYKFIIYE